MPDRLTFVQHPLRQQVVSEMHMRRMPGLLPPARMLQIVKIVAPDLREAEQAWVDRMPVEGDDDLVRTPRHAAGRTADGIDLLWERHSEASTLSLILPGMADGPFALSDRELDLARWVMDAPGDAIRAVLIALYAGEDAAALAARDAGLDPDELVSCHVAGGARIWSDYRLQPDNFGRLIVAANGMAPSDLGRTVQRLQELGNYRNMSLLGFETAQSEGPALAALEARLDAVVDAIGAGAQDEPTLHALNSLAADVGALMARTSFRLSATEAYHAIVEDRLQMLKASPIAGFQALSDFTERRLLPAMRTCRAFQRRLEALAVRAERATSQLRTRIDLAIQQQNSDLLAQMNRSAERQLKMQRLVEGLSVLAISYYAVGLFAYVAKALGKSSPRIDPDALTGLAILPIIFIIWFIIRRQISKAEH